MKLKSFTLIELLIAMGLFSLVATMAVGTFVITQNLNYKVSNLRLVQEEASSAVELISREVSAAPKNSLNITENPPSLTIQKIDPQTGQTISEIFEKSDNNLRFRVTGTDSGAGTGGRTIAGIDFDGGDDYVNGSITPITDTVCTLSAWINPDSGGENNEGRIVSISTPGYGTLFLWPNSRIKAAFANSYPNENNSVSSTTYSIGSWQHVLVTYDNASAPKIYLNGVEVSYSSRSFAGAVTADPANFIIGTNDTDGTYTFDGKIAEVAVWDVALTPTEIAQLANAQIKDMPLQIQPSNLKGYWPMDDGPEGTSADGDTVRDASGNGNNGIGNDGANNTGLTWTVTWTGARLPWSVNLNSSAVEVTDLQFAPSSDTSGFVNITIEFKSKAQGNPFLIKTTAITKG